MSRFPARKSRKSGSILPLALTAFLLAMALLPLVPAGRAFAEEGDKPKFTVDIAVKPKIQIKLTPGTIPVGVTPTPTPRVIEVVDVDPEIDVDIDIDVVEETPVIDVVIEDLITPTASAGGDGSVYINKHGCPVGYDAAGKTFNDLAADCQQGSNGIQFGVSDGGGYVQTQATGDVIASAVQFTGIPEGAYAIVEQVPAGFGAPRVFCDGTLPGEGGQGANFVEESVADGNQIFHPLQSGESFYCDWFNFPTEDNGDEQPPIYVPGGSIFEVEDDSPVITLPECVDDEEDSIVYLPVDAYFDITSRLVVLDTDVRVEIERAEYQAADREDQDEGAFGPFKLQLSRTVEIVESRDHVELHIPLCTDFEDAEVGGTISISKSECPIGFDAAAADVYDLALNCGDPVADVQFILSDGAQAIGQNSTDASGQVGFSGVPEGPVSIVEQVPAGYGAPIVYCITNSPEAQGPGDTVGQQVLDGNQVLMIMPANGEISCSWYNVPLETTDAGEGDGTISIFKGECPIGFDAYSADVYDLAFNCGTPQDGVTFLLSDGASAIATDVTDANGTVGFTDVPAIPVSIVEQVPAGYGEPIVFCISNVPGDNAVGDTVQQQVLDGNQIFHLMEAEESLSCTWYNVPSLDNDAGDGEGTISIFKGECPLGYDAYAADVYDLAFNCGTPQEGVTFLLSDGASAIAVSTTDDTGTAGFNSVENIPVSIVEQVPAGYGEPIVFCISNVPGDNAVGDTIQQQVLDGNQIFHLMETGESLTCTWYNVPTEEGSEVVVHKWTCPSDPGYSDGIEDHLEDAGCTRTDGIDFTLSYGIDTILTGTTGGNEGSVHWDNLPATDIHVTESIPSGYGDPVVYCSSTYPGTPTPLGFDTPEVVDGSIAASLDENELLECWWINIPTDDGEIIVVKYTCEAGYDLYGYGADPKADCKHRTNDIEFTLDSSNGYSESGFTGDSGDKGKTIFSGLQAGTYHLEEVVPAGTEQVFILNCDNNHSDLIQGYPLALESELDIAVEPGSKITCRWYNVPSQDDSGSIQITKYACATEYFVDEADCEIYEGGASFELSGKQGNQWFDAAQGTTNSAGLLSWSDLAPGTYQIDEVNGDWCYAAADNTDANGYLTVTAGETTHIAVWNCGIKHEVKKPIKYPNTGVAPVALVETGIDAPIGAPILSPRQWAGVFDERLVNFLSTGERPVEVQIGSVNIAAKTEILETVDGAMQDPTTADLIAWYKDSSRLGMDGNIVLAGHLNYWGIPEGVFYHLTDVEIGDDIVITGDKGGRYHYRVTWVEQVDAFSVELDEVVGQTEENSVTLITCGGEWDAKAKEYNQRTVVRAVLVVA